MGLTFKNTRSDMPTEFSSKIENEFLPTIIKPGRYAALEWTCPPESDATRETTLPSNSKAPLPLAVVLATNNYERSVNHPLIVATRLALLDSCHYRVSTSYRFGAEALTSLEALELAPFSSPSLTPLIQAHALIVPLSNWSELASLPNILSDANIPISKLEREQCSDKSGFPKLVAVIDTSLKSNDEQFAPKLFNEVFDYTITLDQFLSDPSGALETGKTKSTPVSSKSHSLIPSRPIVPTVEVAKPMARFKLRVVTDHNTISAALVKSIKVSGLTEIEIDCSVALASANALAEIIDSLAHKIEVKKFSLSLLNCNIENVTPQLCGALTRFRRVRIELFALSLSPSVYQGLNESFDREQFASAIAQLQIDSIKSLHLKSSLGFEIDESTEAQECIETLSDCSKIINPSCGLRVKFEINTSLFSPVRSEKQIQELFAMIKTGRRIKGATLALEESLPAILGALIERNAFDTLEEFVALLDYSKAQSESSSQDDDLWLNYQEILSKKYLESNQSKQTETLDISSEQAPRKKPDGLTQHSATQQNITQHNSAQHNSTQQSAFGRRTKRTAITTVAPPTRTRLRFTWAVSGATRFLSHLDNMRAIESALLRSGLELCYTQGQRPRLKISFGAPKPVGFSSECEQFDAFFETAPIPKEIANLESLLPPGYRIISANQTLTKELSILESTKHATYVIAIQSERLADLLSQTLAQNKLPYTRQNKKRERIVDLRPGIFEARILDEFDSDRVRLVNSGGIYQNDRANIQVLKLTLALTDTFYVRPEEFLDVAGIQNRKESIKARIHRLRFGFESLQPLQTEIIQKADVAV